MKLIFRIIVICVLAIGLSGCFVSKKELITTSNADFPFTTMTYTEANGKNATTIKRVGDKYIVPAEKDEAYIRLKKIKNNLYIGQMTAEDGGKTIFLYAIFSLSVDRKSFSLSKAVAEPDDITVAKKGQSGLSICDDGMVCISTLNAYAKYALQPHPKDKATKYRILAIR